jgi:hypothetical protein
MQVRCGLSVDFWTPKIHLVIRLHMVYSLRPNSEYGGEGGRGRGQFLFYHVEGGW